MYNLMLIDADLWCYDIGFAAQKKDGEVLSFDWVIDLIETRLKELQEKLCPDYKMYLTGKGNFRDQIATQKVYKGNRKSDKPHWYQAIRDYLVLHHDAEIVDGIEADDAIGIEMTSTPNCICVSRDKDLRQIPGWHYGYPVGNQKEYGPVLVDEIGTLDLKRYKLSGTGLKFFYSQVLTGDPTDNYGGCKGTGPVWSYDALNELTSEEQMIRVCLDVFHEKYAENGLQRFLEQAQLAWMVRGLYEDGTPVMYQNDDNRHFLIDQIWYTIVEDTGE